MLKHTRREQASYAIMQQLLLLVFLLENYFISSIQAFSYFLFFILFLLPDSNFLRNLLSTYIYITKTCLFKYTENFTTKKWKFSVKNSDVF